MLYVSHINESYTNSYPCKYIVNSLLITCQQHKHINYI